MKGFNLSNVNLLLKGVYQQVEKQGLIDPQYILAVLLSLTVVISIFIVVFAFFVYRSKLSQKRVEREFVNLNNSIKRARRKLCRSEQKMFNCFNKTPQQAVRLLWEAKTVIAALDRRCQEVTDILAEINHANIRNAAALITTPLDLQASPVDCINQFTTAPHVNRILFSYQGEEVVQDILSQIENNLALVG